MCFYTLCCSYKQIISFYTYAVDEVGIPDGQSGVKSLFLKPLPRFSRHLTEICYPLFLCKVL